MSNQDVRWQQRLQNFNKSMSHLESAIKIENPDVVQRAGMKRLFEISFELAWKLLKDYLEDQGFEDVKSPRAAIKKAFELSIISNGHEWLELLSDRNLTAHTYDDMKASEMEELIERKYFPIMNELLKSFNIKVDEQ